MYDPTKEPAMPRIEVMINPIGSLPGIRSLAMSPTNNPKIANPIISEILTVSSCGIL
jgi:hypothetical protein